MPELASLMGRLAQHLEERPDKECLKWLNDAGEETDVLTFRETLVRADAVRRHLETTCKLKAGDKVLLVFLPGLDFIVAFLGCLLGHFIAVPTYPPNPHAPAQGLAKLKSAVTSTRVKQALTHDLFDRARLLIGPWRFPRGVKWSSITGVLRRGAAADMDVNVPVPRGEDSALAFVQFSSGSTAAPKPVAISHGNIDANLRALQAMASSGADDVVVAWLPSYHDMGLVGIILHGLFTGGLSCLMSPVSFLRDPHVWLACMSRYRCTCTSAPNFAYQLCARKVSAEQRAALDLSSCRVIVVGAEPVFPSTLRAFEDAFEDCGFRPEAWTPAYGGAENVVLISGPKVHARPLVVRVKATASQAFGEAVQMANDNDPTARELVGNGAAGVGIHVAIVDPKTHRRYMTPGMAGEIWYCGTSKAQGYFNQPEKTREAFQAHVKSVEGELSAAQAARETKDWYRSGDAGFIWDGEIFVYGRIKDMLIINGRNVFPNDLEMSTERATALVRPGCVAAFSVPARGAAAADGTASAASATRRHRANTAADEDGDAAPEEVVIVVEGRNRPSTSSQRARAAVMNEVRALLGRDGDAFAAEEPLDIGAYLMEGPTQEVQARGGDPVHAMRLAAKAIRQRVSADHGVHVSDVVFIPPRNISKTTSGKIRRGDTRARYESGGLKVMFQLREDEERARVELEKRPSSNDDSLLELGGVGSSVALDEDDMPTADEGSLLFDAQVIMDSPGLRDTDDLFEQGMSSIEMTEMLQAIGRRAGSDAAVPGDFLVRHRTVRAMELGVARLQTAKGRANEMHALPPLAQLGSQEPLRRGVAHCLQLLGIVAVFFSITVPILPAYHFGYAVLWEWTSLGSPWRFIGDYAPPIFGLLLPLSVIVYMAAFSLEVVLLKWIVLGRLSEGVMRMHSLLFLRWWFVDRLVNTWELLVGQFLISTPLLNLVYILMGGNISLTCSLDNTIRDVDLVTLDPHASVSGSLISHAFDAGARTLRFRKLRLGPRCTLRGGSIVMLGVSLPPGVLVESQCLVPEGFADVLPDGVLEGIPCRMTGTGRMVIDEVLDEDDAGERRLGFSSAGPDGLKAQPLASERATPEGARRVRKKSVLSERSTPWREQMDEIARRNEVTTPWDAAGVLVKVTSRFVGFLIVLYTLFYLSIIPNRFVFDDKYPGGRYGPLAYWVCSYYMTLALATVAMIVFKWVLLGRRREGRIDWDPTREWRAWLADTFQSAIEFTFLWHWTETFTSLVIPRLLGASIGSHALVINALAILPSNADMISIGGDAVMSAVTFVTERGGERKQARVGNRCQLGLMSRVGLGVQMLDDSAVSAMSQLDDGEVLFSGQLKFQELTLERDMPEEFNFPWNGADELLAMLLRVVNLMLHIPLLIPTYEWAVWLLYGGHDRFSADPVVAAAAAAQEAPVSREAAILLLAVGLMFLVPLLAAYERLVSLLFFGPSHWFFEFRCRLSVYCFHQTMCAFLHHLVAPILHGTVFFNLYLRFLGASVGRDAFIRSKRIREPQLQVYGAGCVVDENVWVLSHEVVNHELRAGPVVIGQNAYLAPHALVMNSCYVKHGDTLRPMAFAPRKVPEFVDQ